MYMFYQPLWESHKSPPWANSSNISSVFHKQMPVLICITCTCCITENTPMLILLSYTQLFVVPNVQPTYQGPPPYCSELSLDLLTQGVYKCNWTNFQEIPGGISRKIQDTFAFPWAGYVTYRIYFCDVVWLNTEKHDMHFIQHGAKTE